jgi:hypothetical protein
MKQGQERIQAGRKIGFGLPQWFPVPDRLESSLYVVAEIEDTAPCLDAQGELNDVVARFDKHWANAGFACRWASSTARRAPQAVADRHAGRH